MPIFQAETPYRDVYTWNVHIKRHDIAAAPSGAGVGSPLVLAQNEVWRQLELVNNTNVPWTTGAAHDHAGPAAAGAGTADLHAAQEQHAACR